MIYIQAFLIFIIFLANVNIAYFGMMKEKSTWRLHLMSIILILMILIGPIYIYNLLNNLQN